MAILLGAIADDFTGASDLVNTLVRNGMRCVQVIGVPQGQPLIDDVDAVVVALKTRSTSAEVAVSESLKALLWLRSLGVAQYFFKYCSTFDSTASGNIGPVADALKDALQAGTVVVCPAFPENGRTVYNGHLFVGAQLLSESSMRDHPLTPMRDSNLKHLLEAQSAYSAGVVHISSVNAGVDEITSAIAKLQEEGHGYAIIDALDDGHLRATGRALCDAKLITGGSGVAAGLPHNFETQGLLKDSYQPAFPNIAGRSLVIAGSCSTATIAQIQYFKTKSSSKKLDVSRLSRNQPVVEEILVWAVAQDPNVPIMIYSSSTPAELCAQASTLDKNNIGLIVENALSQVAAGLVDAGVRRVLVAGGETSGAVVNALNVKRLKVCAEIAPGVPWTETDASPHLALALKSGNFGAFDFFETAFQVLP